MRRLLRLLRLAAIVGALVAILVLVVRSAGRRLAPAGEDVPTPQVPTGTPESERRDANPPVSVRAEPITPAPQPAQPVVEAASTAPPWIAPRDGDCPASHPVKAKQSSGIFHVPGGASYSRTKADRCYCDEDAATQDGYRRAKS